MTLEQLAQASQLSRGYLSLLERGLKSPSIGTLMRLAGVLELPIERLFDPTATSDAGYVIDRTVDDGGAAVSIQALAAHRSNKIMEPFIMRPSARSVRMPTLRHIRHAGEELLFVLEGEIELELSGERIHLRKGESIYFSGEKDHALSSVGPVQAEVLLIVATLRDTTVTPPDS